tara:strand:+ start:172 stop:999 length:828 start_codon:yes stop_codon:yes gene_type:complete
MSLCYSNLSYQSLLLPYSTYDLMSGYSEYSISKNILFNELVKREVSASLIILPQDIQMSSFAYISNPMGYYNDFTMSIIDYGDFIDSESNISFNAQDIILRNYLTKNINNIFYGSIGLNYINSHIEDYTSSALSMEPSLLIHYKNFLFKGSINNYGIVITHYTDYNESLPHYYSLSLMCIPQYLNSNLLVQHNIFTNFSITNIFGELFIKDRYSITISYTSLAKKLYSEDFSTNFFTGLSIGFNIKYFDYTFNIGIKNLGSIGLMNAITLKKSFN